MLLQKIRSIFCSGRLTKTCKHIVPMNTVKLAQLREKNVQLEQAHRYDVVVKQ